jgi:exopolysaccharide biosynthesis polyprenyl glycosylphosphotransferase
VEIVARERIECVVAAMSERRGHLPLEQLLALKLNGVKVEDGVAFYEKISGKIPLAGLNPSALIFGDGFNWPTKAAKRAVDLLLSIFCLSLTAPLFVLLPVLIKLTSDGPVFYRQDRAGLHGRRFTLLKFRSMRENAEDPGSPVWAAEDDPRSTPLGKFMRKFRLDELPQMLNVLQGAMSVVGPRPERTEFIKSLQHEIPYYTLRLMVKPGITGWAQVMFRYGASVKDTEEKLQYDLFYIKHMSVALDFRIALKTFRTVFFGEGGR